MVLSDFSNSSITEGVDNEGQPGIINEEAQELVAAYDDLCVGISPLDYRMWL